MAAKSRRRDRKNSAVVSIEVSGRQHGDVSPRVSVLAAGVSQDGATIALVTIELGLRKVLGTEDALERPPRYDDP